MTTSKLNLNFDRYCKDLNLRIKKVLFLYLKRQDLRTAFFAGVLSEQGVRHGFGAGGARRDGERSEPFPYVKSVERGGAKLRRASPAGVWRRSPEGGPGALFGAFQSFGGGLNDSIITS